MKNSNGSRYPSSLFIISVALLILAAFPLLSNARSSASSINIVNNSSREIRHAYLSHADADDWTADQLSSTIASGQSATLNNVSCDAQQIRVIVEDQDGCFSYQVVACGGNSNWTITNATAIDCGQ